FEQIETNEERKRVAHISRSIATYVGKNATPLTANNYLSLVSTGDYVKRVLENMVSQVETKHGSTTANLYSSRNSLENLVSPKISYNSSTTQTPAYSRLSFTDSNQKPSYSSVIGLYERRKEEDYLSMDDSYR
ncbi:hypothetical protein ACFL0E_00780, partial [Nanoarchaeota archaeon]